MMHGMYGYGMMWMVLFWVVLIGLGIYLLVKFMNGNKKNLNNHRHTSNKEDTPVQILQKRLANGDIDEAEYERLKSIINRDRE